MHDGPSSTRQRPHAAASSNRVPNVAREHPVPCRRYGLNPKNVAKWRKRLTIADASMGPKTSTYARSGLWGLVS